MSTVVESLKEVRQELEALEAPGTLLGEYKAECAAAGRSKLQPLASPVRYTLAMREFHPERSFHSRYWVHTGWKPRHALQVPTIAMLQAHEEFGSEQHFNPGEPLLQSREDALAEVARQNRDTLAQIERGECPHGDLYIWLFALEIGTPANNAQWMHINWEKGLVDFNRLRFQLVKPTAAEVAKFGKVGAA